MHKSNVLKHKSITRKGKQTYRHVKLTVPECIARCAFKESLTTTQLSSVVSILTLMWLLTLLFVTGMGAGAPADFDVVVNTAADSSIVITHGSWHGQGFRISHVSLCELRHGFRIFCGFRHGLWQWCRCGLMQRCRCGLMQGCRTILKKRNYIFILDTVPYPFNKINNKTMVIMVINRSSL